MLITNNLSGAVLIMNKDKDRLRDRKESSRKHGSEGAKMKDGEYDLRTCERGGKEGRREGVRDGWREGGRERGRERESDRERKEERGKEGGIRC